MADFTPDVQGPANAWMIGRGAEAPDSVIGKLGGIVSNAVDKGVDIFRTAKGNDLQGQEGQELSQAVRDYGSQSTSPLVGQSTNPAESDPGYKAAKGEIDLHASAAAQGAPGSKQALMTRLSEITSRYASQNPYYAPALQEYAQKVLGFNANAALVDSASQAEDFKRGLQQGAQTALVTKAVNTGGAHFNDDGSLDIQTTMVNGQKIVTEEHTAEVALQQAQIAAAQAKPTVTKDQTDDLEFRTLHPMAVQIANAATNGIFSKFAGVIGKAETGSPIDQPAMAAQVAVAQQQALTQVTAWMDKNNIGNTARTQIIADIKSRFEPVTAIFGGDLSNGKQLAIAQQRIKDTYGITFSQTAPHVYAAMAIGGPQAAATIIQGYTAPSNTNPSYLRLKGEMDKYFNAPTNFGDTMRGVNGVMNGSYDPSQEVDKGKAKAVLQNTFPVLDNFQSRPHKLSEQEQKAFGNIVKSSAAAALVNNNDQDYINSASHLVRPGVVAGIVNYAKNPANANDAPKVMTFYGQYLQKTQQTAARTLTQGADTRIVGMEGNRIGHAIQVHYSATTDANGQAVPEFNAKDNQGRAVQLSDAQKQQVLRQDPNFGRVLGVYNQSVQADRTIQSELSNSNQSQPQSKPQTKTHKSPGDTNLDNNNPGNLRSPSGHGWQKFSSMQDGVNAVGHQVALYMGRGLNTIEKIVKKYAPPNENDTSAYIQFLTDKLGKAPTEELSESDIPAVRDAIIDKEQGGKIRVAGN